MAELFLFSKLSNFSDISTRLCSRPTASPEECLILLQMQQPSNLRVFSPQTNNTIILAAGGQEKHQRAALSLIRDICGYLRHQSSPRPAARKVK